MLTSAALTYEAPIPSVQVPVPNPRCLPTPSAPFPVRASAEPLLRSSSPSVLPLTITSVNTSAGQAVSRTMPPLPDALVPSGQQLAVPIPSRSVSEIFDVHSNPPIGSLFTGLLPHLVQREEDPKSPGQVFDGPPGAPKIPITVVTSPTPENSKPNSRHRIGQPTPSSCCGEFCSSCWGGYKCWVWLTHRLGGLSWDQQLLENEIW